MSEFQSNNLLERKIQLIINKYKSPLIYENMKLKCDKLIYFLDIFREEEIIKKNRKWLFINIDSINNIKKINQVFSYLKQYDKNLEILGNKKGEFILDITEFLLNSKKYIEEEIKNLIIEIKEKIEIEFKLKCYISLANNKFLSIISNIKLKEEKKEDLFILKNNKKEIDNFLLNYPIKLLKNRFFFNLILEIFNILKINHLGQIKSNLMYLSEILSDSYINILSMSLGIGDIYQYKMFKPDYKQTSVKFKINENDNPIEISLNRLEFICHKLYKEFYSNKFKCYTISIMINISDDKIIKKSKRYNSLFNSFEDIFKYGKEILLQLFDILNDNEKFLVQKITIALKNIINFEFLSDEIWNKEHSLSTIYSDKKSKNKKNNYMENFIKSSKKKLNENKSKKLEIKRNNSLQDITSFINNNIENKKPKKSKSNDSKSSPSNKHIHLIRKGKKTKSKSKIQTKSLDSFLINKNNPKQ